MTAIPGFVTLLNRLLTYRRSDVLARKAFEDRHKRQLSVGSHEEPD
ncbi:hypothetical protein LPU83_pLPU83b_0030 (plasmid) [Rhizobium favelukesii]|uniref:Uncharacterized protein n=1 Tax=Rhizobium favelukesii TaxID=348824 RepID=W6RI40_9HYPH|nr:hypothetical protein LPU83_pLPU83b_0030 [Rhizobium favelukesii]